MDHRHPGQPCRDPAHDIGADAAVQMHQIRPAGANQPVQTPNHQQIGIPMHRQTMHLGEGRRRLGQRTAARTGQQILMPPRRQPTQQMQHLEGPAVEMTPALDMQNLHARNTSSAARRISSLPIARMQSNRPSQVGRRLQGEQGSA